MLEESLQQGHPLQKEARTDDDDPLQTLKISLRALTGHHPAEVRTEGSLLPPLSYCYSICS